MQEELYIEKKYNLQEQHFNSIMNYTGTSIPPISHRTFTRSLLLKTVEPSCPASGISPRTRVQCTHSEVLSTDVNRIPPPWSEGPPTKTDVFVQIFCDRHQEKDCRNAFPPLPELSWRRSPRRWPLLRGEDRGRLGLTSPRGRGHFFLGGLTTFSVSFFS